MGGCATKPKVLKGEEGEATAPEPAKEEAAATPTNTVPFEAKDVVVVVEESDEKNKKAEDEKVDEAAAGKIIIKDDDNNEEINKEIVDGDQESKPRSLSNLFKNEQGKDSTEAENAPSEPVKEERKEAENPKEESETTQKTEVPLTPESFVDATDKDYTAEKTAEASPATTTVTETKTEESIEKKIEEAATESEEAK